MSEHQPEPTGLLDNQIELPEAVIAQAEAAASSNQPAKDGQRHGSSPEPAKEVGKSGGSNATPSSRGHATANGLKPSAPEEAPIEQVPQLAYGPKLGHVDFSQDGFDTKAKVAGMIIVCPTVYLLRC